MFQSRRKFLARVAQTTVSGVASATFPLQSFEETVLQPSFQVPSHACDCHIHIIGPQTLYPMTSPRVYTPPEADTQMLRNHLSQLHLSRVVMIQPSFYGSDNRLQLKAAAEFNGNARVVIVIDDQTSEQELAGMVAQGARGVRLNLQTAGVFDVGIASRQMIETAARVKEHNMHIQIYATTKVITGLAPVIEKLSVPVVLDHFASIKAKGFEKSAELPTVLELVKTGKVYVKLSGVYRVSEATPDYSEVKALAQTLLETNQDRMVWASDWPHTNTVAGTPYTQVTPFQMIDDVRVFNLLADWIEDKKLMEKVLALNPQKLYHF
jgi:predicted TIM-barrel fold metal-dependent hydrolase